MFFVLGCTAIATAHVWLDQVYQPRRAIDVSVASFNESDADAARARVSSTYRSAAGDALLVAPVLLAFACFAKPAMQRLRRDTEG